MIKHNETLDIDYIELDNNIKQELQQFLSTLSTIKTSTTRRNGYLNLAIAFDTETTSALLKKVNEEYKKFPFVYIWQLTIRQNEKELTIIGRKLTEFDTLLKLLKELLKLGPKKNAIIFIHNYSFEHSFLFLYFNKEWGDIFYTKENTPLYGKLTNYYIEFRCSYLLTGYGLAKLPTTIKKLKGELDYDLTRTPETPMEDHELAYCINDTRVLAEYVDILLKDYVFTQLPLTKTGFVRKGLEKFISEGEFKSDSRKDYIEWLKDFIINDPHEYFRLKACNCGGHSAVNPRYADMTVDDSVICYDFASSYPSVQVRKLFPKRLKYHEEELNEQQYEELIKNNFALTASITFHNIRPRILPNGIKVDWDSPIHISQLTEGKEKIITQDNNGKVVEAELISVDCWELSYLTFKNFYEWDFVEFNDIYVYEKGILPKKLIEYLYTLYYKKTSYKDIPEKAIEYDRAKSDINAVYGCGYQDAAKLLTTQDANGVYGNEQKNIYKIFTFLAENGYPQYNDQTLYENTIANLYLNKLIHYNEQLTKGKRCIPLQVGGYTSELARFNLFLGIFAAGNNYIYSDTDSIYVRKPEKLDNFIKSYNENVEKEIVKVLKMYNLPLDSWKPKTVKGKEKPIGIWAVDKKIIKFKALHSKCYMYVTDDGEFHITIAGLNKEEGAKYLLWKYKNINDIFDNFNTNLEIPAVVKENGVKYGTGKNTHYIIYEHSIEKVTDYLGREADVESWGGTFLEPTSFSISDMQEYFDYVEELRGEDTIIIH